ncbi:hypothetical protein SQ510_19865, partial [Clostridioides difficile]
KRQKEYQYKLDFFISNKQRHLAANNKSIKILSIGFSKRQAQPLQKHVRYLRRSSYRTARSSNDYT